MSRELSTPAALYIGGATAVGLASIVIALVEHKRASARGETMMPTTRKPSGADRVVMGVGIFIAFYQAAEVFGGIRALESLELR